MLQQWYALAAGVIGMFLASCAEPMLDSRDGDSGPQKEFVVSVGENVFGLAGALSIGDVSGTFVPASCLTPSTFKVANGTSVFGSLSCTGIEITAVVVSDGTASGILTIGQPTQLSGLDIALNKHPNGTYSVVRGIVASQADADVVIRGNGSFSAQVGPVDNEACNVDTPFSVNAAGSKIVVSVNDFIDGSILSGPTAPELPVATVSGNQWMIDVSSLLPRTAPYVYTKFMTSLTVSGVTTSCTLDSLNIRIAHKYDVNGDGCVSAADVDTITAYLNQDAHPYREDYDVNNDSRVSALDPLKINNALATLSPDVKCSAP